jgi:hypothetical protein
MGTASSQFCSFNWIRAAAELGRGWCNGEVLYGPSKLIWALWRCGLSPAYTVGSPTIRFDA